MSDRPDPVVAAKRAAAETAVNLIEDGMVVGLGTGSTANQALIALARRVQEGLRVIGVPSSEATATIARDLGIPLATLDEQPQLALTIDGADEVDPYLALIKGGGGALLREKIVASASQSLTIIVDESKLVPRLGTGFALPVEVVPFGLAVVERRLDRLGLAPHLRRRNNQVVVTDNGNNLLDCQTGPLADPAGLADQLRAITGIVDHGLFIGLTSLVVVGRTDGSVTLYRPSQQPAW